MYNLRIIYLLVVHFDLGVLCYQPYQLIQLVQQDHLLLEAQQHQIILCHHVVHVLL